MRLVEIVLFDDPPLEEMANLFKDDTGIDYPLWIGKVGGHHGPRIKVSNIPHKMRLDNCFVVSVSQTPEVLTPQTCTIPAKEVQQILQWIRINFDDLMILWWMFERGASSVKDEDTGTILTHSSVIDGLQKLSS